jgi:hypothetical protein
MDASWQKKLCEQHENIKNFVVKELKDCVSNIRTGYSQLDDEFKIAYGNLFDRIWKIRDLFGLIQKLITFITKEGQALEKLGTSRNATLAKEILTRYSVLISEKGNCFFSEM